MSFNFASYLYSVCGIALFQKQVYSISILWYKTKTDEFNNLCARSDYIKKKKNLSPFLATRPFKQYIPPNYNSPRYLLLERKWLKPSWHPKVAFFSWRKTCNFSDDFEGEIWGWDSGGQSSTL